MSLDLTPKQRRVLQLMAEGRELVRVLTDSGLRYATVAGCAGKLYDRTVDPLIAEGLIARNRAVPGSRTYFRVTDAGRAAAKAKDRASALVGVLAQVEGLLEAGATAEALRVVRVALGRPLSLSSPDAWPTAAPAPVALAERIAS